MPHLHDHYDFTVSAFIIHDKKILLVHHKKLDKWLQPGGHVELDEDIDEALWRELAEETGFTKSDLEPTHPKAELLKFSDSKEIQPPDGINVHKIGTDGHQHIDLRYYFNAKHDKASLKPDEHNEIKWFSKDEIDDIVTTENVREVIKSLL